MISVIHSAGNGSFAKFWVVQGAGGSCVHESFSEHEDDSMEQEIVRGGWGDAKCCLITISRITRLVTRRLRGLQMRCRVAMPWLTLNQVSSKPIGVPRVVMRTGALGEWKVLANLAWSNIEVGDEGCMSRSCEGAGGVCVALALLSLSTHQIGAEGVGQFAGLVGFGLVS